MPTPDEEQVAEAVAEFKRFQNNFMFAINNLEKAKLEGAEQVTLVAEEYNALLLGFTLMGNRPADNN